MNPANISSLMQQQRAFFNAGKTRSHAFRIRMLKALNQGILKYQKQILDAVKEDMGKPAFEAFLTENAYTCVEIDHCIHNLKRWMKPVRAKTPLGLKPGRSYRMPQPYGAALIIAPWNYPLQLILTPLAGAIAAGNTSVCKPSEYAPASSRILKQICDDIFEPQFVKVVEGDANVAIDLLKEKWHYVFFSGGVEIGRKVMLAAANHLTPVTLELGGKSPCFVDSHTNLNTAAKRIAWGKFFNAGQTCVAPDYVLVDTRVKQEFIARLIEVIRHFYGDNPEQSSDYARIVNARHFKRIVSLIKAESICHGGRHNPDTLYIEPTILDNVSWEDPVMGEEIFGPVLPVFGYNNLGDIIKKVKTLPKPLSLYVFSNRSSYVDNVVQDIAAGNVCVNDVMGQIITRHLPFGGVGASGMGSYHGKASFDTFSHFKPVLHRSIRFDPPFRYPPYTIPLHIIRKVFRLLVG